MKLTKSQTFWLDRFVIKNSSQTDVWKQQLVQTSSSIRLYLENIFQADIFKYSLFLKNIEARINRISMPVETYKVIKGILTLAGLLSGILIYVLSTNTPISTLLLVIPFFTLFGFCLIDWYVLDKDQELSYKIHYEFPKFLDLLHLYSASAAYENIGSAMYAISHTMNGALAKQLQDITAVQRFVDNDTFLNEFEKRVSSPLAKDLVSTLKLTEIYGGNISEKIGILAEESHKARMQNAKKQGQRASAALLIPLMLFHFPVAVVIFLAPTALALQKVFGW